MIDREEMIRVVLGAEDGPGLKFSYGALLGEREDMEERRRLGAYQEPELNQRLQAVRHLLAVGNEANLGHICMIISLLSEIQNEQSLRRIYELAEYLCTHEDEGRCGMKDLRQEIVELVGHVNDLWILRQIHRCVVNMTKEGVEHEHIRQDNNQEQS